MPSPVVLPQSLTRFLARRPGAKPERIHAEASRRNFFRIHLGRISLVAMVYPEPSQAEVEKFCLAHRIFQNHGLRVPRVDQILDGQVIIQEDVGDLLLQRAWRDTCGSERRRLLGLCRVILGRLADVPAGLAATRLDAARQEWEMDFFITHFHPRFPVRPIAREDLRSALNRLVGSISPESTFAHRDFHSRNLLVLKREIVMVDFQDSLVAPRYYDLVSLAFDSYLDLGTSRGDLFPNLVAGGEDRELRQLRLTALQRNVKALGTFAYQTYERHHPAYARYIPRTLRHVRGHLAVLAEPELDIL
jgi:aminoglycoside/choline kinase family phosphotransferase